MLPQNTRSEAGDTMDRSDRAPEDTREPWIRRLLSVLSSDDSNRPERKPARAPQTFDLEVVDAHTGRPLGDIAVRSSRLIPRSFHPYDQKIGPALQSRRSPVRLPLNLSHYFVRAEGYAWEWGFGSRPVSLRPGGAITVNLVNYRRARDTWLVLSWGERELRLQPPANEPVLLEHVPAGECHVAVRVSRPFQSTVLDAARVEIPPNGQARTTLRLNDPPSRGYPLAGRVESYVPAVRIGQGGSVSMVVRVRDGQWSAGRVPAGRYSLELEGTGLVTVVNVVPPGRTDVILRVPKHVPVTLRVVDQDGVPVRSATLAWICVPPEGARLPRPQKIWNGREPAVYFFRAPRTDIEIRPGAPGTDFVPQRFGLQRGKNEFRIVVRQRPTLRVRIRMSAQPRTVPEGFHMSLAAVGHSGAEDFEASHADERSDELIRHFTQPGRYRITFQLPGQFRAVPPREVSVGPGATEITLNLQSE